MKTILQKMRPAAAALLALLGMTFNPVSEKPAALAGGSNPALSGYRLPVADAEFTAGEFKPLLGRWRRPDGGYVLEIQGVSPDGKLDAYYYNPNAINVHRAEATLVNSDLKLVVELRDAGYPGSTYALLYRPDQDVLVGYYFQAGRKQYFEVVFVRQK